MAAENFSSSTVSLKVVPIGLCIVLIVHIVGYSLPRWTLFEISEDDIVESIELPLNFGTANITDEMLFCQAFTVNVQFGLWKYCTCKSCDGFETCSCDTIKKPEDWLKAAQAMETLGIIGLLISISISVVILCSRQDKTIRVINITIVASSGIFILIGVTVFGIKTSEDTSSTNLSGEFSICVFSGVLCLLVCPLLLHDYVTYIPNAVQRIHPTPVQVINQGHVMIRPPGNSNAVINTVVPQPVGYMPTYTQAYHTQPGYIVPTQITQYPAAQQQAQQDLYEAQYS